MYDYSELINNRDYFPSWEQVYNYDLSYPENLLNLFRQAVILPQDFYSILTAYTLLPSVLCKRVPYLFLYGISGSGKSTIGKLIAYIHNITITSSETTYAAIRNSLRERKHKYITISQDDPIFPERNKLVEANAFMVWEDISSKTFLAKPEIYNMFKFGYDKSCDTIQMSSDIKGQNETFRCFCPKVFSSIDPIHALDDFKELRRRLIVIPTNKIENDSNLLDIDTIDFTGFNFLFQKYWNIEQASIWLTIRKALPRRFKGLSSTESAISQDVIANQTPLKSIIESFVEQAETNAKNGKTAPCIYVQNLKSYCETHYLKGYLIDKPHSKAIYRIMREFGYQLNRKGQWIKQ